MTRSDKPAGCTAAGKGPRLAAGIVLAGAAAVVTVGALAGMAAVAKDAPEAIVDEGGGERGPAGGARFLAPSHKALNTGLAALEAGPEDVVSAEADATGFAPADPFGLALPGAVAPPSPADPSEWHEFYFTRAAYSSPRGWGRRGSWATDYPKADIQFLTVLKRLTNLDAFDYENAVLLTDDRLRRYPFLYALEVGYMTLSPEEITGLRDYLMAGGFLVIDDFWGTREWLQFEYQMRQVFPDRPIIDLDLDHPVFSTFYDIDEILQVPAYRRYYYGGTSERDGYVPYVRGIEDAEGRLMVIINWNTDLGDAWEWAEQPDYPLEYSTFAFQMGVNMIVYAMSH